MRCSWVKTSRRLIRTLRTRRRSKSEPVAHYWFNVLLLCAWIALRLTAKYEILSVGLQGNFRESELRAYVLRSSSGGAIDGYLFGP